jgi:hypothetical protein
MKGSVDNLAGIQQLRPCTPQETAQVMQRLVEDRGAGPAFAATLTQLQATLYAGLVVGTEAVGELTTIWTNLAGVRAWERHGRPCFLVSEATDALRDPVVPRKPQPKDDLVTILAMIEAIEQGTFSPLAALANCEAGLYILDGNKSAVACYQHARQRKMLNAILPIIVPCLPSNLEF